MTRAKTFSKPNGDAGSAGRPNGHAPASPSRETCAAHAFQGGAASDDSRAFPSTAAANPAAAGMEHDEYAEVAPPQGGKGKTSRSHESSRPGKEQKANSEPLDIPPGVQPLAKDGPGFVDTMHAHVDLYLACARLVRSGDEKIAQRMVERLLEMCYDKSPSAANEEPQEPAADSDSTAARSAAQGAKS